MIRKIPIGIDDFSELVSVENKYLFVDKTLFIKECLDDGVKVSLIIRPRRWGKTINMSMLRYFFASQVNGRTTQGLFDTLNIATEANGAYMKYQGSHPVILVSFKDIKEDSWDRFLEEMYNLMTSAYIEHEAILLASDKLLESQKTIYQKIIDKTANQSELKNALKFLSGCLEQHYGQKVIILIDEYDTPLNIAYERNYFDQAVSFLKKLLGAALKGNAALERGILTGILRLSKNKMLSDLNNLFVYSMMDKLYSRYFGFSEIEIQKLFAESGIPCDLPMLQKWYNGYRSGDLLDIYNPWSILSCIKNKGVLDDYWIRTGDEALLNTIFIESGSAIKEKINTLIAGGVIESGIDEYISFDQIKTDKEDVLWSLLWALGYLKTVEHSRASGALKRYRLKIPNYEVETSYRTIFMLFMSQLAKADQYENCLSHLMKGEVDAFADGLRQFLLCNVSYFDCSSEANYHMLLLGMSSYLRETHDILSNQEQGHGRPDLVFIPIDTHNPLGIILEFKRAATGKSDLYYQQLADQGLEQINKHHYDVQLGAIPHIKQILKLCIVFYGKSFSYKFVIHR